MSLVSLSDALKVDRDHDLGRVERHVLFTLADGYPPEGNGAISALMLEGYLDASKEQIQEAFGALRARGLLKIRKAAPDLVERGYSHEYALTIAPAVTV